MRCSLVLLLCLAASSCKSEVCPPAQLSTINARYVAAAAAACANTPPSKCGALPALKAARIAEEEDAGCL